MIIKEIILQNFSCYYGTKSFQFVEGTNLVHGLNQSGKSKLFDAIYWVFNDKIYDEQSREYHNTHTGIVSGKAINENPHHMIDCSVTIIMYDENKDHEYWINRSIQSLPPHTRRNTKSNLMFKKKNEHILTETVPEPLRESELSKLFPIELRNYMWYKGEKLDTLVNFEDANSLSEAINALSNIKQFEKIATFSTALKSTVEKEFTRQQLDGVKDLKKRDEISSLLEKNENKKLLLESAIQDIQKNIVKTEYELNHLLSNIDVASEIKTIQKEIDNANLNYKSLIDQINRSEASTISECYLNYWLLGNTADWFHEFSGAFNNLERVYLTKLYIHNHQFDLPLNIPEPIHIDRMLEEEKCFVCNRSAVKGSEEWKYIESLANRNDPAIEVPNSDFYAEMQKLYRDSANVKEKIEVVQENKKVFFDKFKSLISQSKEIDNYLEAKNHQLKSLSIKFPRRVEDAKNVVDEYIQLKNKSATLTGLLHEKEVRLNEVIKDNETYQKELTKNSPMSKNAALENKNFTISALEKIIVEVKSKKFEENLLRIEQEANEHLREIYSFAETAIIPTMRIEKNVVGYIPRLYNEDGSDFQAPNRSLIDAIQLSLIMAIVTAKIKHTGKYTYPLIADAIASTADSNLAKGFLKRINSTFKQSIVILMDMLNRKELAEWYDEQVNIRRGNEYLLSITGDSSSDRLILNQANSETIISKK